MLTKEAVNKTHKPDLDATKGILICLIVLGHNYFFSRFYAELFLFLYNFHVASFLLFPFLFRYEAMNSASYVERMFRALVPQAFFLALVVPIYYVMFVAELPGESANWLSRLPLALTLQTETQLDAITGFRHFWFLPAMTLLVSLLWVYDHLSALAGLTFVLLLTVCHFIIGEIEPDNFQYYPWGAAIVGFLFLPGLIARWFYWWSGSYCEHVAVGKDLLLFSVWLMLAWIVIQFRYFMPLAGDPVGVISGLTQPVRLVIQDLFLLISFFAVLRLGSLLRTSFLVPVGKESLKIFLLTPLVWQCFWRLGGNALEADTPRQESVLVALTFVLTMTVSYSLARLISATPLQRIIFPRRLSDWRIAFK